MSATTQRAVAVLDALDEQDRRVVCSLAEGIAAMRRDGKQGLEDLLLTLEVEANPVFKRSLIEAMEDDFTDESDVVW